MNINEKPVLRSANFEAGVSGGQLSPRGSFRLHGEDGAVYVAAKAIADASIFPTKIKIPGP